MRMKKYMDGIELILLKVRDCFGHYLTINLKKKSDEAFRTYLFYNSNCNWF